jgi:hypothetical protein
LCRDEREGELDGWNFYYKYKFGRPLYMFWVGVPMYDMFYFFRLAVPIYISVRWISCEE